MRLTLKMDLDNAAFEGDVDHERNGAEIGRILSLVADGIAVEGYVFVGRATNLYDSNGNRVGTAEVVA